jgi:hypothetical protein
MSLKSLLGLENSKLTEGEIMQALSTARRKQRSKVTFESPYGNIVVQLSPVNTEGVMRFTWNSWE